MIIVNPRLNSSKVQEEEDTGLKRVLSKTTGFWSQL